jgi:hypothetical protein
MVLTVPEGYWITFCMMETNQRLLGNYCSQILLTPILDLYYNKFIELILQFSLIPNKYRMFGYL